MVDKMPEWLYYRTMGAHDIILRRRGPAQTAQHEGLRVLARVIASALRAEGEQLLNAHTETDFSGELPDPVSTLSSVSGRVLPQRRKEESNEPVFMQ